MGRVVIMILPRLPAGPWGSLRMVLLPTAVVLLRLRIGLCAVAWLTIAFGAVWISLTPPYAPIA